MKLAVVLAAGLMPAAAAAQHPGHHPPASAGQQGGHAMTGLFGPYPMSREASGTSWQPESTPMFGYHFTKGSWMLMVHGTADAVYDHQGGDRGETEFYAPTMGMIMAQRPRGARRPSACAACSRSTRPASERRDIRCCCRPARPRTARRR